MFWRRRGNGPSAASETDAVEAGDPSAPIRGQPGISRPAAILRVAGELERRGYEIVDLFEEVESARFRSAVVPIHYRRDEENRFAEVETGPWDASATERVLGVAAALRASSYATSGIDLFSAYPVPREVRFLIGDSPAALLQLELHGTGGSPESLAEGFKGAGEKHWGTEIDYSPESLPLAEELLLSALSEDEGGLVTDALVRGLGCYLGEVVRRNSSQPGSWQPAFEWGEEYILEFDRLSLDPVGKARAFLDRGREDSISYYVSYALGALKRS